MTLADARDWVIVVGLPLLVLGKIVAHFQRLAWQERELEISQERLEARIKRAAAGAMAETIEALNWNFIRENLRR